MNIIILRENPDMKEEMARWFHEKWGNPLEAYLESMEECLRMAARCCTGDLFYISRDYDMHRFSVGQHPVRYSGYREACALLEKGGNGG